MSFSLRALPVFAFCVSLLLTAGETLAQGESKPQGAPKPLDNRIAATVDGQSVFVRDVDRELQNVLKGRKADTAAMTALRKQTLKVLIDRRLVLKFLSQNKMAASKQDLDLAVKRVQKQLAQQEITLADYLKKAEMTEADLRQTLAWQIGWRRYLERYLTDKNLERYFGQHRAEFDGTKLRAAHVLFKVPSEAGSQGVEKTIARAQALRKKIEAKEISFADAANANSDAPSGKEGGDVGWISRREPMSESFSKATFALKDGEVSQPVVSPFGVHLIQRQETKPGKKTWQDARNELKLAVSQFLFTWAADGQRASAKIEYSGTIPGTGN